MPNKLNKLLRAAIGIGAFLVASHSGSAEYPLQPVRFIVAYPPGGATDVIARLLSISLKEALGQPVIIENRVGAGGVIGTELIARSAPDGYTIGFGGTPTTLYPALVKDISFDVMRAFTHLSTVASSPLLLVTTADLPIRNMQELVAYSRANPGKLNFAVSGVGAPSVLMGYLAKKFGLSSTPILYKGNADVIRALASGEAHLTLLGQQGLPELVKGGRIRTIATTGSARAFYFADTPTMKESGFTELELDAATWFGIVGPAGMADDVSLKLSQTIARAARTKEYSDGIGRIGYEAMSSTREGMSQLFGRTARLWGDMARDVGIKPE